MKITFLFGYVAAALAACANAFAPLDRAREIGSFLRDLVVVGFLTPLASERLLAQAEHGSLKSVAGPGIATQGTSILTVTGMAMTRSFDGIMRGARREGRSAFGSVGLIA